MLFKILDSDLVLETVSYLYGLIFIFLTLKLVEALRFSLIRLVFCVAESLFGDTVMYSGWRFYTDKNFCYINLFFINDLGRLQSANCFTEFVFVLLSSWLRYFWKMLSLLWCDWIPNSCYSPVSLSHGRVNIAELLQLDLYRGSLFCEIDPISRLFLRVNVPESSSYYNLGLIP